MSTTIATLATVAALVAVVALLVGVMLVALVLMVATIPATVSRSGNRSATSIICGSSATIIWGRATAIVGRGFLVTVRVASVLAILALIARDILARLALGEGCCWRHGQREGQNADPECFADKPHGFLL